MNSEEILAKFKILYEQQGDVVKLLDANNKLLAQQAEYVSELSKVRKAQEETSQSTKHIEGSVTGLVGTLDRLHGAWEFVQQGMELARKAAEPLMKIFEAGIQQQNWQKELTALTGSSRAAGNELAWLGEQSKHLDFRLPQLVDADQQLRLFGMDARKLLPDIAEAADQMHKPLEDVVQALNLASLGATRGLKRFGIDVGQVQRETGIQLVEGMKLTRDQNRILVQQIVDDWKTRFGEGVVTTEDALTRIGSAWDRMKIRIAQGPIGQLMAREVDKFLKKVEELDKAGKLDAWADSVSRNLANIATAFLDISKAFAGAGKALSWIAEHAGPSSTAIATRRYTFGMSDKDAARYRAGWTANQMPSFEESLSGWTSTAADVDTGADAAAPAISAEQRAAAHARAVLRAQMKDTGRGGIGAAELIKSFVDQSSGTALDFLTEKKTLGGIDFASKGGASTVGWLPPTKEIADAAQTIQDEIARLQGEGLSQRMATERAYSLWYSGELRKRLDGEKAAKTLALGFETGFVNSIAANVQRLLTVHKTEKGLEVAIFKAAGREMLASFLDFEAEKMKVRATEEFAEGVAAIASALGWGIGPVAKGGSAVKHFAAAALFGLGAGVATGASGAIRNSDQKTQQGIDSGFGPAAYGSSQQPSARDQAFLSGGAVVPTSLTINATYIQQGGVQVFGENGFVDWYQQKIRPLIRQDVEELGAIKVPRAA